MCLIKSLIHKNNWHKPFIAKNNIIVYKALDTKDDGNMHICTPYMNFPIIFDNGKCVMKEPRMDIYGDLVENGIHSYTTEQRCKETCDDFFQCTGTRRFWAVIPKGSEFFVGIDDDIVSNKLIIFKTREEFRKYKNKLKCVNLNKELWN